MRTDEAHHENVCTMLTACRAMGVDPDKVSEIISDDWINEAAARIRLAETDTQRTVAGIAGEIHFSAGYLQATSNLTGVVWAAQLAELVAAENYANEGADK